MLSPEIGTLASLRMHMSRPFQIAALATLFTIFSLSLWRLAFVASDWAVLALLPLAAVIGIGFWPLTLSPWKARLHIALRPESQWGKRLTGKIRAMVFSVAFTLASVGLFAWQALRTTAPEALLLALIFFLSALAYFLAQNLLLRHFHQPFARAIATSLTTWVVAIPATGMIAWFVWAFAPMPGTMLDAGFQQALQIGLTQLPPRGGWLSTLLSVPFGYEAVKLWVVVQLQDYPALAWLFSLDVAFFSFILCRTGIVVAQFIDTHVLHMPPPSPLGEEA